jgi:hypothetical protein
MKKRYIMEYLEKGRTQEIIYSESLKEARQEAARRAKIKNITEYSVIAG